MVTVGIDPHKHVHVAVAIDADGRRLTRPLTAPNTSLPSPTSSTAAHAKRSAGKPQPSACLNCSRPRQPTTCCNDP